MGAELVAGSRLASAASAGGCACPCPTMPRLAPDWDWPQGRVWQPDHAQGSPKLQLV